MISLDNLLGLMLQYQKAVASAEIASNIGGEGPTDAGQPQPQAGSSGAAQPGLAGGIAAGSNVADLPASVSLGLVTAADLLAGPVRTEASLTLAGLSTPTVLPQTLGQPDALPALAAAARQLLAGQPAGVPVSFGQGLGTGFGTGAAGGPQSGVPAPPNESVDTEGAAGTVPAPGKTVGTEISASRLAATGRAADPLGAEAPRDPAGASARSDLRNAPDPRAASLSEPPASAGEAKPASEPDRPANALGSALSVLDQAMGTVGSGERTGIASSFMYNAAMTPGWPQRLLANPNDLAATANLGKAGMTDEEALAYLAALGADEQLLAKLKKAQDKGVAGKKILFFMAALVTALTVVIDQLRHEVEELAKFLAEEDREAALGGSARRRDRHILRG